MLTLKLRSGLEQRFWDSWARELLLLDVASSVLSAVMIVVGTLNTLGLFRWSLSDHHQYVAPACWILVVLRLLQLAFIRYYKRTYWRGRFALMTGLKVYFGAFVLSNVMQAAINRPGYYRYEWLGGITGEVTSSTIVRALLVTSGAAACLVNVFQYPLPFRYSVLLQLGELLTVIRVAWGPTTTLIYNSPKLAAGGRAICEIVSEASYSLVSMGFTWEEHISHASACAGGLGASRIVLQAQLLFAFVLPLMMTYIVECEAKIAFLSRTEQRRLVRHNYRIH